MLAMERCGAFGWNQTGTTHQTRNGAPRIKGHAPKAPSSASPQDERERDPTDKSAWNSDRRCQRIKSQSGSEPPNVRPRCEQPTEQRHRLPASSRKNLTTNQFALSKKYGSV